MPSLISPNVTDDFAMTSSALLRHTLSSESSKLRKETESNPEPIIKTKSPPTSTLRSPTPPSQQAVRVEPAALMKSESEPQRTTPLDRYWTEDRRKHMFRAEPNPEPTKLRPIESPYERKFVKSRPSTPTRDEPRPSHATTPKPESPGRFGTTPTPIQHHFKIPK